MKKETITSAGSIETRQAQTFRKRFYAALAGTIAVAICCFTPILVITFAAAGLSAFTPYLDYVLFPALGLLVILTVISYMKWKKHRRVSNEEAYEDLRSHHHRRRGGRLRGSHPGK